MLNQIVSLIEKVDDNPEDSDTSFSPQLPGEPLPERQGGSELEVTTETDGSRLQNGTATVPIGEEGAAQDAIASVPEHAPTHAAGEGTAVEILSEGEVSPARFDSGAAVPLSPATSPQRTVPDSSFNGIVVRNAQLELTVQQKDRELEQLRTRVVALEERAAGQAALLQRAQKVMLDAREAGSLAGEAGEADELQFEVDAAVAEASREPMKRLERIAEFHASTIAALEASNTTLRQQIARGEADHERAMAELQSSLEDATLNSTRFDTMLSESAKHKEETARLVKKLTTLQTLSGNVTSELALEREQNASLMKALQKKEDECELLRQSASQVRQVESTQLYTAIEKQWWGPGVQRAAKVVDHVSMRFDTVLRGHAWLRVAVAVYLFLLHLYVFHVVTSLVHGLHGTHVAEDAQDHVANHMHH